MNTTEFLTDGNEYHIILNCIDSIVGVGGLTCEIGLRLGGGSKLIMDRFIHNGDKRIHVAIDPYGDIPYSDINGTRPCGYSNRMRNRCLIDLYQWALDRDQYFLFFQMESSQFFQRFSDGVPVYHQNGSIENRYAFVHVDGQHTLINAREEFEFFRDRMSVGGIIVFDDINNYDHAALEKEILASGYNLIQSGTYKKAYRRDENNCVS